MFDDHPVRKQALLKYKNIEFIELPNPFFFQRDKTKILVKSWNFPLCLFLNKMGFEMMFPDHSIRKQAFPDKKISI